MKEIKNLRKAVYEILQECPETRNSDQYLTLKLWTKYYPSRIVKLEDGRPAIALRDIMDMPREDNVKRVRAKIQNEEKMFLPTSWEVARQRQINEQEWKDYCLTH